MRRLKFFLLPRSKRLSRIRILTLELARHEEAVRNVCHAIAELTEPGDEVHTEVVRILEALNG